jgi:hypothetical protein
MVIQIRYLFNAKDLHLKEHFNSDSKLQMKSLNLIHFRWSLNLKKCTTHVLLSQKKDTVDINMKSLMISQYWSAKVWKSLEETMLKHARSLKINVFVYFLKQKT